MTTIPARPLLTHSVSDLRHSGLRVEAGPAGRLWLSQADRTVLAAQITPDRAGVELTRPEPYRSPLPPLRAADARAAHPDPDGSRWAHRFLAALTDNPLGPLHSGTWLLTGHTPGPDRDEGWRHYLDEPDDTAIDWFGWPWHGGRVLTPDEIPVPPLLPLRGLSGPDAARVKSYRGQSRDGVLPPILAWWVSGLFASVILDGHDRLVAAYTEDRPPRVITLGLAVSAEHVTAEVDAAVRDYEQVAEAAERHRVPHILRAADRALTNTVTTAGHRFGPTRAFPRRDGPDSTPIHPGHGTESAP